MLTNQHVYLLYISFMAEFIWVTQVVGHFLGNQLESKELYSITLYVWEIHSKTPQ
jgi:hypothetical protein